jgi:hypothetical protein
MIAKDGDAAVVAGRRLFLFMSLLMQGVGRAQNDRGQTAG